MLALYSAQGLHGVYWKGPGATGQMAGGEPKVVPCRASTLLSVPLMKPVVCLSTRTSEAQSAAALCPVSKPG